ncbi:MAG: hypothetical protein WAO98_02960 [Alphaproteobacteria bacterium]
MTAIPSPVKINGFQNIAAKAIGHARDHAQFWVNQVVGRVHIADTPHMDEEAARFFLDRLETSAFYMEYGSGGSTIQAVRRGKAFVSVESDPVFLSSLLEKAGQLSPDQKVLYADIGLTGLWSYPVFKNPAADRMQKWSDYPETPWRDTSRAPDLILIDGRFRVASALTCLQHLGSEPATMLIDDYAQRPSYKIIADFADLTTMCGRMAVFQTRPKPLPDLRSIINGYRADWR